MASAAAGTRSIRSAVELVEATPGSTTRNIVAAHRIVTAQLLTDLAEQRAENPLPIGRRAPEIRFQDKAATFRAIEQAIEPGLERVQGVAAE